MLNQKLKKELLKGYGGRLQKTKRARKIRRRAIRDQMEEESLDFLA